MFSVFSDFLPFEKVADVNCPVCKTTLREFKNTLKLGCPNCYEAFREEISSVIKKIAPYDTHKQDTIKEIKSKPKNEIEDLREQLKLAVKEERYEDASKIKKQINKLEAKNE